jgi:hypothetical protein
MTTKPIRDDVYDAMRAALTSNGGYIYRGRRRQPGPATDLATLLMLERRHLVRLVRTVIPNKRTGQRHLEVIGGWINRYGRTVLRDEVLRRNDAMLAQLAPPAPRSVTAHVDPFALISTGGRREPDLPF